MRRWSRRKRSELATVSSESPVASRASAQASNDGDTRLALASLALTALAPIAAAMLGSGAPWRRQGNFKAYLGFFRAELSGVSTEVSARRVSCAAPVHIRWQARRLLRH